MGKAKGQARMGERMGKEMGLGPARCDGTPDGWRMG